MQAIAVNKLTKVYANGINALKGVSLAIEQGDFFALLGANGAGKSTLIGIVTDLVRRSSGDVTIMGIDLSRQPSLAKAQLGVMPQEINLNYFETCLNILLQQAACYGISRRVAKPRCHSLLEQVGLAEKKYSKSGYLSGGMKRRLMIARALVHDPEILILDEPTAGVDIEIRQSLWQLLSQLNQQGKTIILTTHYLEEAEKLCKNIAVIDQGEIIKHTSMRDLLNQMECETLSLVLTEPLSKVPELLQYPCQLIEPHILQVAIKKHQYLTDLCHDLAEQGIRVHHVGSSTGRLERLFTQLIQQSEVSDGC